MTEPDVTRSPLARARAARRIVDQRRDGPPPVQRFRHRIKEVVLLGSSSRGGSTITAELLRRSRHLLHFRAEVNLFLGLTGHDHPSSATGSDRLGAEHLVDPDGLELLMAWDAGRPSSSPLDEAAVASLGRECHWRLAAQWPLEPLTPEQVASWTRETLDELRRAHGWRPGAFEDPALFWLLLLRRARLRHPRINAWAYDLAPEAIRRFCPSPEPTDASPSPLLFEEPPLVSIAPWEPVRDTDFDKPLLIKTPSNAYRLPFFEALFPNARLRLLHLTRNAAAAINGLYDGWRFRGFHSHRVDPPLRSAGYSDEHPDAAGWWKFDLPPGWRDWTDRPLVEICGFQWRSAHQALLDYVDASGADHLRVPFEHVIGSEQQREALLDRACAWLGIPFDEPLQDVVTSMPPPLMATSRPRHRRWFDKAALIEPVLERPDTRLLNERLGYVDDPDTWL